MSGVLAVLLLLLAQQPLGPETAIPYRVGPGDVLELTVEGRPELSRLPTVQPAGTISLPRGVELAVAGLTVLEISSRIGPLLAGPSDAAPIVMVRVYAHHSQFVWTRGALTRPGRKALRSGTRLVDALLDSGGFLKEASGEVVIERTNGVFADGSRRLTLRFRRGDPAAEDLQAMALPLAAGDVVSASQQDFVSVTGAIRNPGRYPYEAALTVSRVVAGAGGLLPTGDRHLKVRRRTAEVVREIEADLDAIRRGKQEDLVLLPGDEISVGRRGL